MNYVLPTARPIKGMDEPTKQFVLMEAVNAAKKLMQQHQGKNLFLVLLAEHIMKELGPVVDKEMAAAKEQQQNG